MLKIARKIIHLVGYRRADRDLVDEMEFHRALTQQQLEKSGVPPLDAACASRRALGNTTLAREDARAVWIWPWLESIWQDIVYALRSLRREPAFTLVALVALGGAIGLNTSLFTTFSAFMWRPWPVKDPDRIVTLVDQNTRATFSLAERDHFARYSRTLSGFIATRCLDGLSEGCTLKLDDADVSVDFVTPNYFQVLGIGMIRGAGFSDQVKSAAAEPIAILSVSATRPDDVLILEVSAGYFDTLQIPIVSGRNFEATDRDRDVIVITESLARRLWSAEPAVGRTIRLGAGSKQSGRQGRDRQVIGVVKDVHSYYGNVTTSFPTVYSPIGGRTIPRLIVRHLDPGLTQSIAAVARRIEPRAQVLVTNVKKSFDRRLQASRMSAWIAGVLGLLAVTLTGIGVFSLFAYTVEQRTVEIGIRLALGARSSQIVWALLGSNLGSVLLGLAFGIAGALAASQVLRSQLHGLSPFDPISYAGVAAVLTISAVAATIVPARRATRIDPITALRCD